MQSFEEMFRTATGGTSRTAGGGYSPETGFDTSAQGPVAASPELRTPAEQAEALAHVTAGPGDSGAADNASVEQRR